MQIMYSKQLFKYCRTKKQTLSSQDKLQSNTVFISLQFIVTLGGKLGGDEKLSEI